MKRQKIGPSVVGTRRYFEASALDTEWTEKELNGVSLSRNCCNNIIAIENNSIRGYFNFFARSLALFKVNGNWELILIDKITQIQFKYFLIKELQTKKGKPYFMKMEEAEAECNDFQLVNLFLPVRLQEVFASIGKKLLNPASVTQAGFVVIPDDHFSSVLLDTKTPVKEEQLKVDTTSFSHYNTDFKKGLSKHFHTFFVCVEKSKFPLDRIMLQASTKSFVLVPEASHKKDSFFQFKDLKLFTRTFHLISHRDFQSLKEEVDEDPSATYYQQCLIKYRKKSIELWDFDTAMNNNNVRFVLCTPEEFSAMEEKCKVKPTNFTKLLSPSMNEYIYTYNNVPNIKINGTCVSSFSMPKATNFPVFTMNDLEGIEGFLKGTKGFGSRSSSPCLGINLYFGPRGSPRPKLTPFVHSLKVNRNQDYYRQLWGNQLTQIRSLLKIHLAADRALQEATLANRTYLTFLAQHTGPRLIYTAGTTQDDLSFSNFPHIDCGDKASDELTDILFTFPEDYLNDKRFRGALQHLRRVKESIGMPLSTTCGHTIIAPPPEEGVVVARFLQFDFALSLQSKLIHHFFGHAYCHATAATIYINKDNEIRLSNKNQERKDYIICQAWGSTPSTEVILQRGRERLARWTAAQVPGNPDYERFTQPQITRFLNMANQTIQDHS